MPQQWDLPHVDHAVMSLPEAKVGIWGGYVFVNHVAVAHPQVLGYYGDSKHAVRRVARRPPPAG
jgi:hypothetical protein